MSSSNREPRSARELRRALLERVEKHDGHWYWTGTSDHRGRPVLRDAKSARKAVWAAWRTDEPPPRLKPLCGERACVLPEHLIANDTCPAGHTAPRTAYRSCKACIASAAGARWVCEGCDKAMRFDSRHRHLRSCRGRPVDTEPIAALSATQDAVRDYQRGMTPERICEVYGMKPDTLAQRLRRQEARTPGEDELMHALDVYAKRALLARQRAERS